MRKISNNKKGFTLVELLAVIVVLAIIILIAMPSVMSAMDKARRNALVTESTEIAKVAQTAFADKSMGGSGLTDACFGLHYLVDNGYLDKKLDGYSGYVTVTVDPDGKVSVKTDISNGIYRTSSNNKKENSLVNPSDMTSDTLIGGDDGAKVDSICSGYTATTGAKQVFKSSTDV